MSDDASIIQVVGVPFFSDGTSVDGGDFRKMITMKEFDDSIFLFNDNVEDWNDPQKTVGGGSAIVRPYSTLERGYRSAGFPTGWTTGVAFSRMDDQTRMVIDMSFERIVSTVHIQKYTRILFPCASPSERTSIGTLIFRGSIGADVVSYINRWITTRLSKRCTSKAHLPLAFFSGMVSKWTVERIDEEKQKKMRLPLKRRVETQSVAQDSFAPVSHRTFYRSHVLD